MLATTMSESPRNPNIAGAIFMDLRRQILAGALKPGDRLLGERELAQKYGTNRNTLREAVRKLEQTRLVTVRHGRGVTVSDFRRTGTLELLPPFLQTQPDIGEVVQIVEDMLAPRILLLEYAARLAVQRAEAADIERLRDISDLLIPAFHAGDVLVVARGFQRWLDALIEAGHSVAVRWIANPFLEALRETLEHFPMLWILEPTFPNYLSDFIDAVATEDEARAIAVTRSYYERVDGKLVQLLSSLPSGLARPPAPGATPEVD